MTFLDKVRQQIEQGAIDDVESLWMTEMESDPSRIAEFFEAAKLLRQANERSRADALLELLADALLEKEAWGERLAVLREIGRLSKKPANLRDPLKGALLKSVGSRPNFENVMRKLEFDDAASNPVEKAEKVLSWLDYDEGEVFFMSGRGVGVVAEFNADLGVCRLDFEKAKRVPVPLGAGPKFLTPIGPDHILRRKITEPEALAEEVVSDPPGTFSRLLRDFGRPMMASEVRDALTGILPEKKWSSWWNSARKHPQIVASGSGARASYAWAGSSDAAEKAILDEFASAPLRQKLELGRKHSSRSDELADTMAQALAERAAKTASTDPSLAWEILATLEKLPGKHDSDLDRRSLLAGSAASRTVSGIPDRQLREQALSEVRETHPEWQKVFVEIFFAEDDPRVLTTVMQVLDDAGETEIRGRLIDETLRYPRRHAKAFYWYCRSLQDQESLPDKIGYPLLFQMLDMVGAEELGPLRARMRELFDKGGLAVQIVMNRDDEEQARKLFTTVDRFGQLEDYRRDLLKSAVLMKYPKLNEPEVEAIYSTSSSLEAKRKELDHLLKVEIPENSKAIQVAREMGDLRENFEYKAARARAEYLSARVGQLQSEIMRVRVLEPGSIDTSEIRVGTRVALSNGELHRDVTILGPWESDPEHGVYSHQSEIAHALMGHKVGDIVSFMGNDYRVDSISRFDEQGAAQS